jgi:hypothetical protein
MDRLILVEGRSLLKIFIIHPHRAKKNNRERKWIRKQRIKPLIILIKSIFKIETNTIKLPIPMIHSKLLFNSTNLIKLRYRIKRKNIPSFSPLYGTLIMKIKWKNNNQRIWGALNIFLKDF